MNRQQPQSEQLLKVINRLIFALVFMVFGIGVVALVAVFEPDLSTWFRKEHEQISKEEARKQSFDKWLTEQNIREEAAKRFWHPAVIETANLDSAQRGIILYGKELIMHTAKYLGPKGTVAQITNGMNCQNCHLDAGTKIWGNKYGAVYSTYPKYRARSGSEEDIYKRVNDCVERSLNGRALATDSKEMQAMKSYIEFIGSAVKKGTKAEGAGLAELPWPDRVLDTSKGRALFATLCQSCHQPDGGGLLAADQVEYIYPPLWGKSSYNEGAGLFRVSRFAAYIKNNMPQGVTYIKPQLSDDEAWDIAAFVNSQPRPVKDLSGDWPKIEEKPIDHPFGPYADHFSATQHKYGPFQPITLERKKQQKLRAHKKPL